LRTAREGSLEDPFLFFLALSMAEHELVLSWPTVDERGNRTVVSPFVDEVAACVQGDLPRQDLDPTAIVPPAAQCGEGAELVARAALDRWAPGRAANPDRLAGALRSALPDGAARLAAIDRRALIEERRARYFLATDPARKDTLADAYVGRLAGAPTVVGARVDALRWSPSALEILGGCGFRFFAARLLGLAPEDEPELEMAGHEQGRLMHAVLAAFFTAVPELPSDREAARALGRTFMRAERARLARTIAAKDPHFFALAWTRLEAALDELIVTEHAGQRADADAGITVERRLEEPLEFTLADPAGGPPLRLGGRPDRVELHRRGAETVRVRVLDYKVTRDRDRFRARLDPARDLGRTSFQIPVYLLGTLARDGPGMSDDAVCEGSLVAVLAGERGVVREEIARELLAAGATTPDGAPTLAERIRRLVARARAGRFDVAPDPCDPFCAYRSVCRYQPPPLEDEPGDG